MTIASLAISSCEMQVTQVVSRDQQPLSTSQFPRDVSGLDRATLEETYRKLRYHYRGVMISRGIHRNRCVRQASELQELSSQLRSLAFEQAGERAQIYLVLEQISTLAQHLEDDGDSLVTSFQEYQFGGHRYGGAPRIGGLVGAVIQFINNWGKHKQAFRQLVSGHQFRAILTAASEHTS